MNFYDGQIVLDLESFLTVSWAIKKRLEKNVKRMKRPYG